VNDSRKIYLDYNATAPLRPEVHEVMQEALDGSTMLNPSSIHWAGRKARQYFESARRTIGQYFDRKASEIIFTGGGSEADNLALLGLEAERIIVSSVEHPAVLQTAEHLKAHGREIIKIPVDGEGQLDLEKLEESLNEKKCLVSIMAVNNETGVIFPTDTITKMAHKANAIVHVDAVQAIGRIPVPSKADLISISGHKLGASVGVGALITRERIPLAPMIYGGSQEHGRRAGTGNVVGAAGLAKAVTLCIEERTQETQRLHQFRAQLEDALNLIDGAQVVAQSADRVANTVTAVFDGLEDESLLHALDLEGFACSSGSACASGSVEASHVLLSMGIPRKLARSALRISYGWKTSATEITTLIQHLGRILAQVKKP